MVRRSTLTLAAAVGAAVGASAATRRAVRRLARNPDPTDGLLLDLPPGRRLSVTAEDGSILRGVRMGREDAPTVLLVHGLVERAEFYAPVAQRLGAAGDYDVIAIDQRGHGRSDRGRAPYTPETLASDLRAWIEQLGLRDVTLVGHSMGGVAAMALAGHQPDFASERLASMLVFTTLATHPLRGKVAIDVRRVMPVADLLFGRKNLGLLRVLDWFGDAPSLAAAEAVRSGFLGTDRTARADALEMFVTFDLRPLLGNIRVPTTLLAGEKDGLTPLAMNRQVADGIPGVTFEVVAGTGHFLFFEAPDLLTDRIADAVANGARTPARSGSA